MKILLPLILFLTSILANAQQYNGQGGAATWKSTVSSAGALPATGNLSGDVRIETTAFGEYVWNGGSWVVIGGGGGGGTVTSVGLSLTGPLFTVSGSPVVGAGTLTGTINTQGNNLVFAGPNGGGPLAPTFRSLVAADIPSLSGIYLPLSGGTMSGAIAMGANKITGMSDPTLIQDAATKNYVDTGLATKQATLSNSSAPAHQFGTGFTGPNTFNYAQPAYSDISGNLPLSVTAPITTTGGTSPTIGVTSGNLTDAGTDGITVTGGASSVLGAGTSLSQHVGDDTHNGYLLSTDHVLFKSKSPTIQPTQWLYVDNIRTDIGPGCSAPPAGGCLTAVGSVAIPFLTVQAAVNAISSAVADIEVGPGSYPETVTLNGGNIQSLIINGHDTTVNAINSSVANTGIFHLEISGFTFNAAITMMGDINNTSFCNTQCEFHHDSFASTLGLTNLGEFDVYDSFIGGVMTVTNATSTLYGGPGAFSDVTLVTNGGNQPSGFSQTIVDLQYTQLSGTLSIDSGSLFQARFAGIIGTIGGTITNAGTFFLTGGSVARSNITNIGTFTERGASHLGTVTGTIAYTANTGYKTLMVGTSAVPVTPLEVQGAATFDANANIGTFLDLTEIATPANPAASHVRLYSKAGDGLYYLNSAGLEQQLSAGGGTVTSVALTTPAWLTVSGSPITTSGTLAVTGTSEPANQVLASPNGSAGALSPRSLVAADIPSLSTLYCALTGCTMSGAISMGSQQIHNVLDPTSNQDAATKLYVDTVAANGVAKGASVYATTAALPANTYNNGASGVGATLTGVAFGALVVDGNTVSLGQRILVKNEVTQANNGIYTVTTVGAVATLYVLTRATDFDVSTDIVDGTTTYITSGATLSMETWQLTVAGVVTVGTTALVFNQISGPGTILAGTGLTLTGSVISLNTPVLIANGGTNSSTALNNNRVMQSSGGSIVEASAITANRALISDANGIPTQSVTTSTELSYVSGVTSAIQTQLNTITSTNGQVLVSTKSGNYTVLLTDQDLLGDATSGSFTFTLPSAAASFSGGKSIVLSFTKIDSSVNSINVTAAGSDKIDGLATQVLLNQYNSFIIRTDGSNWYVK